MRRVFNSLIRRWLERLVRVYFKRNHPKLVVVVGSIGKTSTKMAIATVLAERFRVRVQEGNMNEQTAVPLGILGVKYPDYREVRSVGAWLRVLRRARRVARRKRDDVDVIIQELGTDHPGEIPRFGEYLRPDIAVVTAITPEHMENFKTLDAVAVEELSVGAYSRKLVVNQDDIPEKYRADKKHGVEALTTFGLERGYFRFRIKSGAPLSGYQVELIRQGTEQFSARVELVGEHNLKSALAAAVVGVELGMDAKEIAAGLGKVRAVAGRMNVLPGKKGSVLLDDTYNSSPEAAMAALKTLYRIDAPQRIAVVGQMNELGDRSPEYHGQVGEFLDGKKIDLVITEGEMANKYLAAAARKRVKHVIETKDAREAGEAVLANLKPGAAVLFKGSQNGVYLEEAVKMLLKNPEDVQKLVRQSSDWRDKKGL